MDKRGRVVELENFWVIRKLYNLYANLYICNLKNN